MRLCVLLMGIVLGGPLVAQEGEPNPEVLAAIAMQMDAVPGIDTLFEACPATIQGSRAGWFDGLRGEGLFVSDAACAADVGTCLRACLEGAQKKACFHVAKVFQTAADDTGNPAFEVTARKAFALSCAMGLGGGCTNRGGAIRNYPIAADVQSNAAQAAREACLFDTFAGSCGLGDSWGCAMLGQAYANGEGVAQDVDVARDHLVQACVLANDPAFESCVFARSLTDTLAGE